MGETASGMRKTSGTFFTAVSTQNQFFSKRVSPNASTYTSKKWATPIIEQSSINIINLAHLESKNL